MQKSDRCSGGQIGVWQNSGDCNRLLVLLLERQNKQLDEEKLHLFRSHALLNRCMHTQHANALVILHYRRSPVERSCRQSVRDNSDNHQSIVRRGEKGSLNIVHHCAARKAGLKLNTSARDNIETKTFNCPRLGWVEGLDACSVRTTL